MKPAATVREQIAQALRVREQAGQMLSVSMAFTEKEAMSRSAHMHVSKGSALLQQKPAESGTAL